MPPTKHKQFVKPRRSSFYHHGPYQLQFLNTSRRKKEKNRKIIMAALRSVLFMFDDIPMPYYLEEDEENKE